MAIRVLYIDGASIITVACIVELGHAACGDHFLRDLRVEVQRGTARGDKIRLDTFGG